MISLRGPKDGAFARVSATIYGEPTSIVRFRNATTYAKREGHLGDAVRYVRERAWDEDGNFAPELGAKVGFLFHIEKGDGGGWRHVHGVEELGVRAGDPVSRAIAEKLS